jgi:hypothetical protein|uniref:Uncharacterized protein n=1 Tax=viral metagenome TaxID=1070528 RepID=A0A6C0BGN1_9ZZZZ
MSVRRSERLAQLWLANHPPANSSTVDALNEMYEVAMEAFTAVHRVHTLIKERATFEEKTQTAIASVIQVIWAIEDAHEFKTRQLMGDKGEQVLAGHAAFMEQLRRLTKEAENMATIFSQHVTLSPSLLLTASNLGTDVVKTFYIN